MAGPFDMVDSDYKVGEGVAMVAPLIGMDPADIRAFLVIGIHHDGSAGIGGTPNLSPSATLLVLEHLAAHMRARGVTPGP
jgi:L-cystine uptake protein TcyP (sodium:dicarboxylate symporter family)